MNVNVDIHSHLRTVQVVLSSVHIELLMGFYSCSNLDSIPSLQAGPKPHTSQL